MLMWLQALRQLPLGKKNKSLRAAADLSMICLFYIMIRIEFQQYKNIFRLENREATTRKHVVFLHKREVKSINLI